MKDRILERAGFFPGFLPQTINNSNVTGRYYPMAGFRQFAVLVSGGDLAATKTCKVEVYEAEDASGTNAALITGATKTVTANTLVAKTTTALASTGAGDIVAIAIYKNGDLQSSNSYVQGTDFTTAAQLTALITALTGVSASTSTTNTITLADAGYLVTMSYTDVGGTGTVATNEYAMSVDVSAEHMSSGNTHLAAKVTSTGNGINSCEYLITDAYHQPTEAGITPVIV